MANEIKVDGKFTIQTKGLDTIVATLCFAYGDKCEDRDALIKLEIMRCVKPFVDGAMANSSFYEKLSSENSRDQFIRRFGRALFKRYKDAGILEGDQ